jgi:hypothetical protein
MKPHIPNDAAATAYEKKFHDRIIHTNERKEQIKITRHEYNAI